jgi:membrane protein
MSYLKLLLRRLIAAYSGFSGHDGPLMAAAVAYYLALSLFPLMLVLVAVLGWTLRFTATGQNAQQHILAAVSEQASPALSQQLSQALSSVEKSAGPGGAIGIAVLIATAIALFTQIDFAFDKIWDDAASAATGWRQRAWRLVFVRLKALLMLMAVGAFILAVMIASLVWQGLQSNVSSVVDLGPWFQRLVQPLVHILLNLLAFTAVYQWLPKTRVRWSAALAGGLLASALWELGRQVLAAYVVGEKLPTAYGLIGSFMAIMLWTYYAMMVILFGAAYTRVINEEADEVRLHRP